MQSDPIPKTLITGAPESEEAAAKEWVWDAVREQAGAAAAGEARATAPDD